MGAHPADPSHLPDGQSLLRAIQNDPAATLGTEVASRFDSRLPFLMKLLAAAEPLSLQVHPNRSQAVAGYEAEDAAGIRLDAPERNYRDRWSKPELILALTRFEGMAGWRAPAASAEILRALRLPLLDEVADRLSSPGSASEVLREVVTWLLALPPAEVTPLVEQLTRAATTLDARPHRISARARPSAIARDAVERESLRVVAQTVALGRRYPADAGVLVTLLLNHVVLARGEAMFLNAGVVHSYTSGFALEVMANSDNVLRAGLTGKHVDPAALLRVTDFEPTRAPILTPEGDAERIAVWAPPVAQFQLSVASARYDQLPELGPRVLLCLEGTVEVAGGGESETLAPGDALFIPHQDGAIRVSGVGRVAVCGVPQ